MHPRIAYRQRLSPRHKYYFLIPFDVSKKYQYVTMVTVEVSAAGECRVHQNILPWPPMGSKYVSAPGQAFLFKIWFARQFYILKIFFLQFFPHLLWSSLYVQQFHK